MEFKKCSSLEVSNSEVSTSSSSLASSVSLASSKDSLFEKDDILYDPVSETAFIITSTDCQCKEPKDCIFCERVDPNDFYHQWTDWDQHCYENRYTKNFDFCSPDSFDTHYSILPLIEGDCPVIPLTQSFYEGCFILKKEKLGTILGTQYYFHHFLARNFTVKKIGDIYFFKHKKTRSEFDRMIDDLTTEIKNIEDTFTQDVKKSIATTSDIFSEISKISKYSETITAEIRTKRNKIIHIEEFSRIDLF